MIRGSRRIVRSPPRVVSVDLTSCRSTRVLDVRDRHMKFPVIQWATASVSYTSACQDLQNRLSTTLARIHRDISDLWRYGLAYLSGRIPAGLLNYAFNSVNALSAGSLAWAPAARENQPFATLVRCEFHLRLSITLINGKLPPINGTHSDHFLANTGLATLLRGITTHLPGGSDAFG